MKRKIKHQYVAPVGDKLPDRPAVNATTSELWTWLSKYCNALDTWIPFGAEPETMSWDDPMESVHNERDTKFSIEKENNAEVRAAFDELLKSKKWPETTEEVSWLACERLKWAAQFANMMASLSKTAPKSGIPLPCDTTQDWIIWMVFTCYDLNPHWPRKWWNSSSFERWHGL